MKENSVWPEQVKKKKDLASLSKLRFEKFREGLSMQIMHIGLYSTEPQTIQKMKSFADEKGYKIRGKHHEIYLGDPRKAQPEKLKTVLRYPIEAT